MSISLVSFTYCIIIGLKYYSKIKDRKRKVLSIGTIIFALTGYIETIFESIAGIKNQEIVFDANTIGFAYVFIFYMIWNIFIILYIYEFYLHREPQTLNIILSEEFIQEYELTDREKELIRLIVQGFSNSEISESLSISISTVKTHVHNILKKTGAKTRYKLINLVKE